VFFVALCRSLNIPTIIDPATSEISQYVKGRWEKVVLEPNKNKLPTGKLTINFHSQDDLVPQYWTYYTISKFSDGYFHSLDFEGDKRVEKFPVQLELEEGYYCLTTGNRYANGNVLARNEYFSVSKSKQVVKELTIRELEVENKTYGVLKTSILPSDYYDPRGMVICFLEPDREPTKHIMNELPDYKTQFDKWSGKFVFVVPTDKTGKNFTPDRYKNLPENSTFILNNGEKIMDEFLKSANQSFRDNYPLIYIVDSKGQIIFYSEGYRIGVGDLISKTIKTYYK